MYNFVLHRHCWENAYFIINPSSDITFLINGDYNIRLTSMIPYPTNILSCIFLIGMVAAIVSDILSFPLNFLQDISVTTVKALFLNGFSEYGTRLE